MLEKPPDLWDAFLNRHPNAHILQTGEWGDLKAGFGWEKSFVIAGESGAQVLFRSMPLGFTLAYIPKGPLGKDWDTLWSEVDALCRTKRAIFLKVEPDYSESQIENVGDLFTGNFLLSPHFIQPPRTLIVDLNFDDDALLAKMKQKTRYNIRLAKRKGVIVHPSPDVEIFHNMMQITRERDKFGIHSLDYFNRVYNLFHQIGGCELLVAEYNDQPLAGLMVFAWGKRAWYFYGASSNQHRNLMPTYLLQWEAMRWAREKGCILYDLWGVPDADQEILENEFSERSDGLWGVYRFKRGFGGRLVRSAGSWDRVYIPSLYRLYRIYLRLRSMPE
jgi:lipid II:glycine glycyltransferase (peptidoglycan interpeptide bridge formation enzyme)